MKKLKYYLKLKNQKKSSQEELQGILDSLSLLIDRYILIKKILEFGKFSIYADFLIKTANVKSTEKESKKRYEFNGNYIAYKNKDFYSDNKHGYSVKYSGKIINIEQRTLNKYIYTADSSERFKTIINLKIISN